MTQPSVFGQANEISKMIQDGEIKGVTAWPISGTAKVQKINSVFRESKQYLSIDLIHPTIGTREFLIAVPGFERTDAGIFMGFQKIYATLFVLAGCNPTDYSMDEAYHIAQKTAIGKTVNYELEEYEQMSSKTGKYYTNQSLKSLCFIEARQAAPARTQSLAEAAAKPMSEAERRFREKIRQGNAQAKAANEDVPEEFQ
jgi:hypothetical protein